MSGITVGAAELINKACETGKWESLGWEPKSSCKCMGRGHRGRNKVMRDGKWVDGDWNICKCVQQAYPFIMSYIAAPKK